MLAIEVISVFFFTSVLLSLSPGPDNIFVLMQSITQGSKAGSVITLGLCTGLLVHSTAAILGVALIFQTSELAFTALKLLGAGYLLYLAWGAFRAKPDPALSSDSEDGGTPSKQIPLKKLYLRGIIMNITNPKVSIFFLAFLPQFVNPEAGNVSIQLALLSLVFIIAALLIFNLIALLSGRLGGALANSERAQTWLNRISGTVFVGLAAKLAITE